MPDLTRPAGFLVVHILRVKGVAEASSLVTATGLSEGDLEALLAELAVSGLVERRDAPVPGWRPTALGVEHDRAWSGEELEAAGGRGALEELYRSFLTLNPELLAVCTAWQLVTLDGGSMRPNDHRDPGYDAAVVSRLAELHGQADAVLVELEGRLARFGRYRLRLEAALERIQAGEGGWFTRPLIDSYHQVWFELHQDLLDTLGLERTDEPS